MAVPTIFLQLSFASGILQGESVSTGFENQIVIDSFDWSATAPHVPSAEKTLPKWTSKSVKLSKVFDRASTALYANMKGRKQFTKAILTVVDVNRVTGNSIPMLVLRLENGHVDSISTTATDAGLAMKISEKLTLSFVEGELSYFPLTPQGGRSVAIPFQIPKMDSATP